MKKGHFNIIELSIYYVVIFFILREWLVPIMMLTGTGYTEFILLFIAVSLLLSLARVHFAIAGVIKLAYMGWFIVYVYSGYSVMSEEGFQFLLSELQVNLLLIFQADWVHVTDSFRTLLFFILIWMLVYLIHHWITVKYTIFYFLVLTVCFIATLDTFTDYDGSEAIVKIILLGLIMTASLYIKRMVKQANVTLNWFKYIKLLMPIVLLIGVLSVIAIILPKSPPQWPDPVPFLKSATGNGGTLEDNDGVSKVGYGENDSYLGGAFTADDTVVFVAESETKQYWRVETKDVYTSKGWEKSNLYEGTSNVYQPDEQIYTSLPVGPEEETNNANVLVVYPYQFIAHPYGVKSIDIESESSDNVEFHMDSNSEKIVPKVNQNVVQLSSYAVSYSKPVYLYSDLKNPTETIEPSLKERYLQLPDNLPARVKELAEEIVEGKETPYEKARAIEMYFRQNGFRYDTDEVAIPDEDQDYVDQFLFETKIGYCDNFSTSMAVLLRSVGIPARWVKGFAGGDQIDSNGTMKTFQITNNDAHSWVEAYIPNVGWVNFEPTIGFNNSRSINYDLQTDAYQEEVLTVEEDTEPDEVAEDESRPQSSGQTNGLLKLLNALTKSKIVYLLVGLFIVFASFVLYKKRKQWLPKVYLKFNRKARVTDSSIETMYLQLLKVLELKGFKRKGDQTLQAFAEEIDGHYNTNHMSTLTAAYEQYIYSKDSTEIDLVKMKECWEYLINQTTS